MAHHEKCEGCRQVMRIPYQEDSCICGGIVEKQDQGPEFDIIRLCARQRGKWYYSDWAPDEALGAAVCLSAATRVALLQDETYQKFRKMMEG